MPRVVSVDRSNPDPAAVAEAAAVLGRGGLVAFPTETVYGLGARGLHADEVARIFAAKGRPPTHPLILHVEGEPMARSLASEWSPDASRLAGAFWPGPLTLVVPRREAVPAVVSGGLRTVGLRAPAHPVALALLRAVSEALAAPSANAHTHVSPTTAEHVIRSLGDRVDFVLDAGPCAHGIESTVVDLASGAPRVLRPGAISLEALRSVLPGIVYEPVTAAEGAARASPGLAAKHYAPRARVVFAEGAEAVAAAMVDLAKHGSRVAAITWSDEAATAANAARDTANVANAARASSTSLPDPAPLFPLGADPVAYARALFAALHALEAAGCDAVVVERVPDDPAWWAVADRLRRARTE